LTCLPCLERLLCDVVACGDECFVCHDDVLQ
jgi:hypothetical protein